MKSNINTDNYEAYLLDYMEGNLSHDEAKQLKAFVEAQGLDWNGLTEKLPHLEAPALVYDDKENLKKKAIVTPLYVKIASVAAVARLLLTIGLWPQKSLPIVEPVAELKPILPSQLTTLEGGLTLAPRTISFKMPQTEVSKQPKDVRTPITLLASLQPVEAKETQVTIPTSFSEEPVFDLIDYRANAIFAFAQYNESNFKDYSDYGEDERGFSLISRGLLWLTKGHHDSFASLINSGLDQAKQKATETATDIALTAYHRADEYFEETREHWEEKKGE